MREYLGIRLKRMLPLFLVPIGVEIIFGLIRLAKPHSAMIAEVHDLWYAAAAAVILFVTTYQLIKIYYLGSDELINILPFANELLTLIELVMYSILTTIFGAVFQEVNNYHSGVKVAIGQYALSKFLSLLSFYIVLFAFAMIFKNIRKNAIGESLILIATILVIALVIALFWQIEKSQIVHFMIGISSPDAQIRVVYLNILPYSFYDQTAAAAQRLVKMGYLINGISTVISGLVVVLWQRIVKLNYLNLVD
ncbi:hypothetical protein OZX69_07725 [Lactobacillus sp. ESL0731]|uniref:hypothetical protein n=1 Tax=unclassified Lactobacillus TaxID=2620435 RepID=UPI0023F6DA2B|nr:MULTISPECIES: hypothetical protein [unclassified Lactobacillus]WEV50832.1 hypothetical protein OZX63_07720 [Lactobacillus sp. ESL0700]WEV61963.1 hypothetical protein OZX69_07725 [Lactobacillus sp. ESL0731]